MKKTRIIFVTGGVVSSLGKGIVASITGRLLKNRGLKVKIKKFDPYWNIDPGTLSPIEHGEVFVTNDGAETDLDLGHYERLGGVETTKTDYLTSGLIQHMIMQKERNGEYLGKTVTVVPHVIDEFRDAILRGSEDCDILICEIGGTISDIENVLILWSLRQIRKNPNNHVLFIHVAPMIYLRKAQEWKTKQIQNSVRALLTFGIETDLLLCRMEEKCPENWRKKLALLCEIDEKNVLEAMDAESIYHAMLNYQKEGVDDRILDLFGLDCPQKRLDAIEHFVQKLDENLPEIRIAVVGKYISCKDAYKSLEEALVHAAISIDRHIKIDWIDAEKVKEEDLAGYNGILVPGGFGQRASEGKILAIKYARKNNIPFFGICFGLQLAVIESVSEILPGASTSEFGDCAYPVVAKMEEWAKDSQIVKARQQMGGTMRLGAYPCEIAPNTLAHSLYNTENGPVDQPLKISERHRHRYEVNNLYLDQIQKSGIKISGKCGELAEIVERDDCDFFIGCQFHPEFKSNCENPHPIFVGFVKAVDKKTRR